jgi:ubiquinone/menaquinone biosynthesis C-methylase UbiE
MNEFDEKARDWDSDPRRIERARIVAEAMREQVALTPALSALEYGCGTGLLSFALQPWLGQITLADNSDGMLAVLAEKIAAAGLKNMIPLHLDLAVDPLPAERYDLLYTLMVLHHIPDTEGILRKFWGLLKGRGRLCVVDLDQEDGSFHGPEFDGHLGFERAELERKLLGAGFQNVRFHTVYQMPKPTAAGLKHFPLFLAVAEKDEAD